MINRTTMIAITRGSISRKGSRCPRGGGGSGGTRRKRKMRENRCRGAKSIPVIPRSLFSSPCGVSTRCAYPSRPVPLSILDHTEFRRFIRTTMRTTDVESRRIYLQVRFLNFSESRLELEDFTGRRTPTWTSCWFRKIRNTGSIRGRADIEIT